MRMRCDKKMQYMTVVAHHSLQAIPWNDGKHVIKLGKGFPMTDDMCKFGNQVCKPLIAYVTKLESLTLEPRLARWSALLLLA